MSPRTTPGETNPRSIQTSTNERFISANRERMMGFGIVGAARPFARHRPAAKRTRAWPAYHRSSANLSVPGVRSSIDPIGAADRFADLTRRIMRTRGIRRRFVVANLIGSGRSARGERAAMTIGGGFEMWSGRRSGVGRHRDGMPGPPTRSTGGAGLVRVLDQRRAGSCRVSGHRPPPTPERSSGDDFGSVGGDPMSERRDRPIRLREPRRPSPVGGRCDLPMLPQRRRGSP